jgi:hypothetical protein
MSGSSLAELLARAEQRKYDEIRRRLGIPAELVLTPLELESLAYHLGERSGPAHVRLEADGAVRVGESAEAPGLLYRGAAARFLLATWGISESQARAGCALTLKEGRRAA